MPCQSKINRKNRYPLMKVISLKSQNKSDLIGAFASGLCLLHCIATPLLFIVQTCSATCCEASPSWWKWLDYIFLVISFVAIFRSSKTTTKRWIGQALWLSWSVLAFIILNEKTGWLLLPEFSIYIPALALIALHLYNQKYCQCNENCIHETH